MAMDACARGIEKRSSKIKRILLAVFFFNVAVALAKYLAGVMTSSAAMQADGIHSLFDSAGNLVGILGISLAARPADDDHPYGHGKFETYGSFVIGVFLLFAAGGIGFEAVQNLMHGVYHVEVTPVSFAVMFGTLAVNLGVSRYEYLSGKRLRSSILRADSLHTLSDSIVSVGVIVGLVLVALGWREADSVMALFVTAAILFSAVQVFKQVIDTLADHVRIDPREVAELAMSLPGVVDAHNIRSRGTDSEVYVDLHVLVDPTISIVEAHDISTAVEELIRERHEEVAEVLVHIEPDYPENR